MLALERGGAIVADVVLFPLTGEWFYAEKGKGANKNGTRIEVPIDQFPLEKSYIMLNPHHDPSLSNPLMLSLQQELRDRHIGFEQRLLHSGAGIRVVEGESHLSVVVHDNSELSGKQKLWDVAAPKIIIEEVGGVFLGEDLNPYDPKRPGLIIIARSEERAREVDSMIKGKVG